MKQIKLSIIGQYYTYKEESIVPLLIAKSGYDIVWVEPDKCDLLIIGKPMSPLKWVLKKGAFVMLPNHYHNFIKKHINSRHYKPLTLFHTCENLRHNSVKTDYSISFDLTDHKRTHYRLPYWMEMVDWSHEGLVGNNNKRFGKLFSIKRMMEPLGSTFLSKPRKAVIFASHLNGQRKNMYRAVNEVIAIDGFGKYFNKNIFSHSTSGFEKQTILSDYAFNLCPENKIQSGYYTEKIPEAFLGNSLPLTWADPKVSIDFNPKAFINLELLDWHNLDLLYELLHSEQQLASYAEQPLLLKKPSIKPFQDFLRNLLLEAL